jgi:RNA polymerase sigma-70 factor (ECF subfamily)
MEKFKNLTDEELVHLVQTQDQELYREIVHRYQNKILRYTTYLTQSESKAADVTQETFIKAFVNLQSFDLKKKFSSWLYRIAHNEAINHLKKYQKEISLDGSPLKEEFVSAENGIHHNLSQELLKKEVATSLNKLPLIYRSLLALFYLEERSYEEISDVLRIPIGTVGTRIKRGKKILAEIWTRSHTKENISFNSNKERR